MHTIITIHYYVPLLPPGRGLGIRGGGRFECWLPSGGRFKSKSSSPRGKGYYRVRGFCNTDQNRNRIRIRTEIGSGTETLHIMTYPPYLTNNEGALEAVSVCIDTEVLI